MRNEDQKKQNCCIFAGMKTPNLSKLRRVVFWDTNMDTMDWEKYKQAVIIRVFERGNAEEQEEIIRFYGEEIVGEILERNKADSLQRKRPFR